MFSKILFILSISLVLMNISIVQSKPIVKGRNITLFLNDGSVKFGELISLRDSFVVISNYAIDKEEDLQKNPEIMQVIPILNIQQVRLEKVEYNSTLIGGLVGGTIGAVADIIIMATHKAGTPQAYPGIAIYGFIGGLLSGYLISNSNSKPEEFVLPSITEGYSYIRQYARYPNVEPDIIYNYINSKIKIYKLNKK
jgi:hypothetical protein